MLNINAIRYGKNDYTFSSNDKYLYFEVEDDVFNQQEDEEDLQNIQNIDGKLVRCAANFEFIDYYNRDLKKADKDKQDYLESMYKKHYKLTRKAEQDDRRDRGYINFLKDYDSIKPDDYYGLLYKYLTINTLDYIDNKFVFGYLGHEDRTIETDQVICDFLDENPELTATINNEFLTNAAGRHYMDLCDGPEDLRDYLNDKYL